MPYGGFPYGGAAYAGSEAGGNPETDTDPILAVEIAFTTGALETPVWETVTSDVRSWEVSRGRNRELERFQPGRATIVLSNRDRQYDSVNDAGPHFGDIRPMRRIRIRQTFNGVTYPVFDGFVDRWKLGYPDVGLDATATVTATDAMKVFNRTELGVSVYDNEVRADDPDVWWRLDETKRFEDDTALLALNYGTAGSVGDGTYIGPPEMGGEPLIVKDPGGSIETVTSATAPGTAGQGVEIAAADFAFVPTGVELFAFEAWCIPRNTPGSNGYLLSVRNSGGTIVVEVLFTASDTFNFNVSPPGGTAVSLSTSPTTFAPHQRVHLVARGGIGVPTRLWINGVLFSGGNPAGDMGDAGVIRLGHVAAASPSVNWSGAIAQAAFYTAVPAAGIDQVWVDRHYAAGTAPWQGDLPGARLDRVLNLAEWPSTARELDDGATTLQSAEIASQSVLEHSQKVGETEFGLLYIDRGGNVRFEDRTTLALRAPGPEIYGDDTGEIGYRDFEPDDGDEVIRNRAVISRLNGVAKVSVGATIDEFGRFDYVLEGLLHQSDSYSQDYADFIVDEYQNPRRRIARLDLGPAIAGQEGVVYPAILGRELGDAINVSNNPLGGGDPFTQVCVIEGIRIGGTPKVLMATFALSPEFAEALF